MRSNRKNDTSVSLISIMFSVMVSLLISACSGGISGTGNGGQSVVNVDDNSGTGTDSSADGGDDTDGGADAETPTDGDSIPQTPDTSQLVPAALQQLNSQSNNASAALPLTAQLLTLQQQVITELEMTSSIAGTPTTNISNAFDSTLRYTFENSETLIARSSFSAVSFIFSTSNERTFYVLQEDRTVTLRHLNRNSNSLLQARVILTTNGATLIEADLNQNGTQSYLQTYSNTAVTAVFAQQPTDPTIARQRELIDETGALIVVQNCTSASQDCSLDSSWSNANSTNDVLFFDAQSSIDTSLDGIATPAITLPDNISEAVITQVTNDQPTEEQIQCGIQRVTNEARTFCWVPQPLGTTSLFSETLAGSEIFYQLLQ